EGEPHRRSRVDHPGGQDRPGPPAGEGGGGPDPERGGGAGAGGRFSGGGSSGSPGGGLRPTERGCDISGGGIREDAIRGAHGTVFRTCGKPRSVDGPRTRDRHPAEVSGGGDEV